MIRLIKPNYRYWQHYLDAMKEFEMAGDFRELQQNASVTLRTFRVLEESEGSALGMVPCNHFWLLNGSRFIGMGVARHYLDSSLELSGGHISYLVRPSLRNRGWEAKLLSLLIKECGKLGIKSVLVTFPESSRSEVEAARNSGCRVFDQISPSVDGHSINIMRSLADTNIRIQTWRDPRFIFKDINLISSSEIDLELVRKIPSDRSYCPIYSFAIVKSGTRHRVGFIELRVGFDIEIFCSGNIGYYIEDRHRGRGYASKAACLLVPLARKHHMNRLTITCNPENLASAKTAENIGARYLEFIKLPKSCGQYKQGDRFKRRYVLDI